MGLALPINAWLVPFLVFNSQLGATLAVQAGAYQR
jgi:hypothetical protein